MKNDYISQLRENNPGMSRSAAKAKFEENFSPAKQQMYSYTQAAVTGVLNYVSGKILKGGGKYSQAVINKITNSVLGKMTGNVTARDIQVAVYKYLGKRTSNVLTKGARMGLVGVEELTEEIAEAGAGAGIDAAFESMTGLNFENFRDMDSETFWKEFSHMAKVSFLSGMLGGSINVVMDQKKLLTQPEENLSREELKKLDKFYETIADNAASVDAMRQEIAKKKEEFNLGYISEEQFKQYELEVQENYNIYSNIDNGLNGRTIIDIATLTKRKNALEAKLEGKDKKANGRIVDEIDSIDAQIKALSSDSNNFRQKGAEDVVAEQLQKVIDIKKERGEIEEETLGNEKCLFL